MPYPGRNHIYEATIRRMVNDALKAQEQEFLRIRGNDSDGQLLEYLQICAKTLGHTPWPREIAGGSLIGERFGSWNAALQKAKLPNPSLPDKLTSFGRYQDELLRQKVLYREKKAARKREFSQRGKSTKQT